MCFRLFQIHLISIVSFVFSAIFACIRCCHHILVGNIPDWPWKSPWVCWIILLGSYGVINCTFSQSMRTIPHFLSTLGRAQMLALLVLYGREISEKSSWNILNFSTTHRDISKSPLRPLCRFLHVLLDHRVKGQQLEYLFLPIRVHRVFINSYMDYQNIIDCYLQQKTLKGH